MDEVDIDFDDVDFESFDVTRSDKFRIAFAAHMVHLGDESRAYSRALADCGVIPPPPDSLKRLAQDYAKTRTVQNKMSEIRVKLTDSYVDRLQDHMDELADLRDMAKAEGKYAPAVAAEVARGRVQGFYDTKTSDPEQTDVKVISEDDLKKRVADALARMEKKGISGPQVADFAMKEASRDEN